MDAVGSVGTEVNRLGQVFQIEQEVGLETAGVDIYSSFVAKRPREAKEGQ